MNGWDESKKTFFSEERTCMNYRDEEKTQSVKDDESEGLISKLYYVKIWQELVVAVEKELNRTLDDEINHIPHIYTYSFFVL